MEWKAANILFADVKGYSALTEAQMKTFHNRILCSLANKISDCNTRDRNTWGDGIVIISDEISEICEVALLMRDFFKQTRWQKYGLPVLDIRISIHHGEYLEGSDPFTGKTSFCGRTVVTAARIEPVTPPSMIWMTNIAAAILTQHIDANSDDFFAVDEIGEITLAKNFGKMRISSLRRSADTPISDKELASIFAAQAVRIQQPQSPQKGGKRTDTSVTVSVLIGVVCRDAQVLLVKRQDNDEGLGWMFPSAKMVPTGDLKYTIQKEVRQETGVHATYRKKITEVACHPLTKLPCQYIYLEAEADGILVNGDPIENREVRWVEIQEAIELIGENLNSKVVSFLRHQQAQISV